MIILNLATETTAFYDWLLFNPIKPDAISLWHALLYTNNKQAITIKGEWYWPVEFKVPNPMLSSLSGGFTETQLIRMRNELVQAGRIQYKKGRGSQGGSYSLIPFDQQYFSQEFDQQYVCQLAGQPAGQSVSQLTVNLWVKSDSFIYIYNNNTNYNNNLVSDGDDDARVRARAFQLFKNFLAKEPLPPELDKCCRWLNTMDDALVEHAFERACAMDAKTTAYVEGVITNLGKRGIRDMGDLAAWDMDHGKV